jgi:hypothetical protein
MDKDQQGILSKADIELIRNTFGGSGEELLYHIRDVFLQFEAKEAPKFTDDVLSIVRKYVIPELSPDLPIKAQADLYFSLDNIKQIPPEVAYIHIKAMDLMIEYLEQQFAELSSGVKDDMSLSLSYFKEKKLKTEEDRFVDMVAYQSIVAYIENSLDRLRTVANSKDETEEEIAKRLEMDSTK